MATVKITFAEVEVAIEDEDEGFASMVPVAEKVLYRVIEKGREILGVESDG